MTGRTRYRIAWFSLILWLLVVIGKAAGASYRTPNFIIQTDSPQLAEQLGKAAEQYRRDLSVEWLGENIPDWSQPCTMTVRAGQNLGSGGSTTFIFDQGEVFGWRMAIQGSPERLLDAVLPHEIIHMIFASHFRRPLPRWADEGGAILAEQYTGEQELYRMALLECQKTSRAIPFARMFTMTEYPQDFLPLFAQGFSTVEYLVSYGGRRKFVSFLGSGMGGNWSTALQQHYGISDAATLETRWRLWLREGIARWRAQQGRRGPIDNCPGGRCPTPQPPTVSVGPSTWVPVNPPVQPSPPPVQPPAPPAPVVTEPLPPAPDPAPCAELAILLQAFQLRLEQIEQAAIRPQRCEIDYDRLAARLAILIKADASPDYDTIAREVEKRLSPIRVVVQQNGKPLAGPEYQQDVYLGDTLPLNLIPVPRSQ